MFIKVAVVALLMVILGSLASAFFSMVADGPESTRTVRALSWRIGLSVAAFLLLMVGVMTGLVESNAIRVG